MTGNPAPGWYENQDGAKPWWDGAAWGPLAPETDATASRGAVPPPSKPTMSNWAKAYILGMVLIGAGILLRDAAGGLFITAGVLAAIVCFIIGTVWVIDEKRRRN